MFDHAHLVDRIEQSIEDAPTCSLCHAPTVIRDRAGRLWLECSATPEDEPIGLRARFAAAFMSHPRQLILDLTEDLAA
jgi:hypothetical protein